MPGNSFGKMFRVTTWGESHGKGVGVVIDGCPPGLALDESVLQEMLDRRKPGSSPVSTSRREDDVAVLMSGTFEGRTTGTPIMIMIRNKDQRSKDYSTISTLFRPGHGDISYQAKYGVRDYRGGGRASARETAARVAAGAVAGALLKKNGIKTVSWTLELGGVRAESVDMDEIQKNLYCCPDPAAAILMEKRVLEIKKAGDSIGGVVEISAAGVPAGLGDPVFDKLDADLAKALMSIGSVKGVELGAGCLSARMTGSENNDPILPGGFGSNHAGGVLAGISNGDTLVMRAYVKPIPSISIRQDTIDLQGNPTTISTGGRHDVSPIPRVNVVCESMVNLVLAEHLLRQKALM